MASLLDLKETRYKSYRGSQGCEPEGLERLERNDAEMIHKTRWWGSES